MVTQYKMSCSLKGLVPAIGLQLETGNKYNHRSSYAAKTNVLMYAYGECKECGIIFIYRKNTKQDIHYFCSNSCRGKYFARKKHRTLLQLAYKCIDKKAFVKWFKEYDGYVKAQAYELCEGYNDIMNDIIDIWNENAVRHFYNIRKWEKFTGKKPNNYAYLKKVVHFAFLYAKHKHKNEIYYDECPIKIQQGILGYCNYED